MSYCSLPVSDTLGPASMSTQPPRPVRGNFFGPFLLLPPCPHLPTVISGLFIQPSDSNPVPSLAHDFCIWFPLFDLWMLPHGLGLGWVLGSSQSQGSNPALALTKGHPICLNSSHSLVTLLLAKKRNKDGVTAGGREARRKGFMRLSDSPLGFYSNA